MHDKFLAWAQQHAAPAESSWTTEQICDSLIERGVVWPSELTNEQGWQLWTARMRRDTAVKSITFDEDGDFLEVTFRLQDKREFKTQVAKNLLAEVDFGGVCHEIEQRLRRWKGVDDERRALVLAEHDAVLATAAPDLMEHLLGFRAWQLSGHRIKPIGVGGDVWRGGDEVRAECGNGHEHRAPDNHCDCGLYAWHSWAAIEREARQSGAIPRVFGAVVARGRMQIHNDGFRAEYMRPVLIGYDDADDHVTSGPDGPTLARGPDFARVQRIAAHLGEIEVVGFSQMERRAATFGRLVPGELKPS